MAGEGEVILFEHVDYKGKQYKTKDGIPNLKSVGLDNQISSIQIGPHTSATLWGYKGRVLKNTPNLVTLGFNEKALSLTLHYKPIVEGQPQELHDLDENILADLDHLQTRMFFKVDKRPRVTF